MNVEELAVSIKSPNITFYGPHPCELCGGGPIVRGSVSQGFGDIRLDSPNEPIYPNHKWQEHKCGSQFQIGQEVEWDGQEGVCSGKISNITEPFPGSYVLWIGDAEEGLPLNSIQVRLRGTDRPLPSGAADDPELAQFLRDAKALKTSVKHTWTAWLADREDGIVGTGETEIEAIRNLADVYKDTETID